MLISGFAAAYLLAFIHPFGNPGVGVLSDPPRIWGESEMPPAVHAVLAAKCGDCHSLQTRAPLYAHLAPASWLMERDIVRGRESMNLSHWDSDSPDDREILIAKIASVANKREMPPIQYLALHWSARLSSTDIHALVEWAQSAVPAGESMQAGAPTQGDAAAGKDVFEKRCTGCHALDQDREGPHLRGVFGRAAGSVPGFDYSDGLKKSHIVWSEGTLERWLTNPEAVVPDTNMDFYVAKPGERSDVIEFLKELSQQVVPNQSR